MHEHMPWFITRNRRVAPFIESLVAVGGMARSAADTAIVAPLLATFYSVVTALALLSDISEGRQARVILEPGQFICLECFGERIVMINENVRFDSFEFLHIGAVGISAEPGV
jgi:hypothetical protein